MSIRPLSPDLQEFAIKEINEDPKRIPEDLKHIKTWLQKQPHILARTDDQWLIAFLRGCKYSLEKTKEKLDFYYSSRNLTPEFYGNRDPFDPVMQECLSKGYTLPILEPNADGRRVILFRSSLYEPGKVEPEATFKNFSLICDILLLEDDLFVIGGYYAIIDMQFLTAGKLTVVTPTLLKKMVLIILKALPIRPKGMYFINMPSYFEGILKIMMSFMPEKIKRRVKIFTRDEYSKLFETISKDIIPVEYGGEGQSLELLINHWKNRVESYNNWYLDDMKYKTDEKKRVGKPKTTQNVFGVEGSFRKLEVD